MRDLALRCCNLRKVYRLYTRPFYRVLDVLGLLRRPAGAYKEHVALEDVSLEIRRGEKVALIGRNGAGKSTFLKLATHVTQPTSGQLEVFGKTHALLQIGTGFHPDFTGRENVFGYLAYLGVTGKEAEHRLRQIVEFAELEEYIDQPVKTYSTGMGARLMFATSTAISPDILVLDEVLGVGDAYFARKSYERIRELCDRHGTTVLLVSHDIYSAAKICDRMIWIDRGRVLMDTNSARVVVAYEDSIRELEEHRLRQRKLASLRALPRGQEVAAEHLLLEIRARDNQPLPCPVYFSRISLRLNGQRIGSLPLGHHANPETSAHLQTEDCCWGEPVFWQGQQTRPMRGYGSSFHKVAGVFAVPAELLDGRGQEVEIILECWSEALCPLHLKLFHGDSVLDLGALVSQPGSWYQHTARGQNTDANRLPAASVLEINTSGQQGSGAITITSAACLNGDDRESFFFAHGEPLVFEVGYRINDPGLCEHAQVVFQLLRDGSQDVCRCISRQLLFDALRQPAGKVHARLPRLPLTDGTYSVTVMIVREGYYDQEQTVFYSVNSSVYACRNRMFEIVVQGSGLIGKGTVVVTEAAWSFQPDLEYPGRCPGLAC